MKSIFSDLKWRKIIIVSILLGSLFGMFDVSNSFTPKAFAQKDGCPEGEQCRTLGCSGTGVGGNKCVYYSIYGTSICEIYSIDCPNITERKPKSSL